MSKWIQTKDSTIVKLDDDELKKVHKYKNYILLEYENGNKSKINFKNEEETEEVFSEIVESFV